MTPNAGSPEEDMQNQVRDFEIFILKFLVSPKYKTKLHGPCEVQPYVPQGYEKIKDFHKN